MNSDRSPVRAFAVVRLPSVCVASVSPCRAAGRRWGAGVLSALQIPAMCGTRHQTRGKPHGPALPRTEFVPAFSATEDRLRTRKPFIHAVVAVPSVVAVQMSTARSQPGRKPHGPAVPRTEFVPTFPATGDRLRTRKPFIHAVSPLSPLSPLSPVQMSIARSQPGRCAARVAGRLGWAGALGPSSLPLGTGNSNPVKTLVNGISTV